MPAWTPELSPRELLASYASENQLNELTISLDNTQSTALLILSQARTGVSAVIENSDYSADAKETAEQLLNACLDDFIIDFTDGLQKEIEEARDKE